MQFFENTEWAAIYRFKFKPSIIFNLAILIAFYSVTKFSMLTISIESTESIYA